MITRIAAYLGDCGLCPGPRSPSMRLQRPPPDVPQRAPVRDDQRECGWKQGTSAATKTWATTLALTELGLLMEGHRVMRRGEASGRIPSSRRSQACRRCRSGTSPPHYETSGLPAQWIANEGTARSPGRRSGHAGSRGRSDQSAPPGKAELRPGAALGTHVAVGVVRVAADEVAVLVAEVDSGPSPSTSRYVISLPS